ncbi:hypothetical protein JCM18916_645 [Cutibacterium acnes JCM 18916]|nr:hypothetical protein JCM18916_645 [Cutibacterium acnes JCM 18916]GAE74867.1 hypothetical protein JCM18918_520 [Cutibacterium acnes JCM 18918]
MEWVLPSWGAIAKIATNYGPLPAGITRFGSVFFQKSAHDALLSAKKIYHE